MGGACGRAVCRLFQWVALNQVSKQGIRCHIEEVRKVGDCVFETCARRRTPSLDMSSERQDI